MIFPSKQKIQTIAHLPAKTRKVSSLSAYFPQGTKYFYGYPAGVTSDFLNKASPLVEELVAARMQCCSGPNVSVVTFASTEPPVLEPELIRKLAIPEATPKHVLVLPSSIDISVTGEARNKAIIEALTEKISPKSLIMAEPFMDSGMESLYQIPPKTVMWLNDKSNMLEFIDRAFVPARFGIYSSGKDFYAARATFPIPCVIKIPSSSSGDGVFICLDSTSLQTASEQFRTHNGNIIVEQYIKAHKNYAIHFGIPHNPRGTIDIFGFNEQLTTPQGSFLGGVISSRKFPSELKKVRLSLLNYTLPLIRQMGWYGVGGFDVMVDESGDSFIIDCNFRMTGLSAYHFLVTNGVIKMPMVSFGGVFNGTRLDFEEAILPFASIQSRHKIMQVIALSHHGNQWNFNAAISYRNTKQLQQTIQSILKSNISAPALEQLRQAI